MKKVRNVALAVSIAFLLISVCHAKARKPSELMQIPEFAAASPEERLAWINAKVTSKEYTSTDISIDVMGRLIMDVLIEEKTPQDRMKKYGEIRQKYTKLGATFDLEKHLAVEYLAADPAAKEADILGKCKIIQGLHKQKILSWPGIADLHRGMMALHLATSAEYQAMTPVQKVEYLKSMDGLNIVSNQTSSAFSKFVAADLMSRTPVAEQPELYKQIDAASDFFTKTAVRTGYID